MCFVTAEYAEYAEIAELVLEDPLRPQRTLRFMKRLA